MDKKDGVKNFMLFIGNQNRAAHGNKYFTVKPKEIAYFSSTSVSRVKVTPALGSSLI